MRKINEIDTWEPRARTLARYLLEAILPDKNFITKRPSIIVVVVYCLARYMLGIGKWVRFLVALAI